MMQRLWRLTLAALALVAALGGCAPSTTSTPSTPSAQASATPTTPAATPTDTAAPQACAASPGAVSVGGLSIGVPSVLYGFNDDFALPDNLPLQPLALNVRNSESYLQTRPVSSGAVAQQASFLVDICDSSATQSYRLTSVAAMLLSRTPYTGTLNTLNACAFLYSRTQGYGGECASGFSPDLEEPIAFTANAGVGAVVTLPLSPAVTLAPGKDVTVAFETQYAGSNVTLRYQLGVGVDGAAATFPPALRTQQVTLANVTRSWSGKYCDTPQMQAAIPASSPAGVYYACPKS